MSELSYMEKLLDGVEVEWKELDTLTKDRFWIMPATPKFDENEKIPYITSKNIRGGNINFEKTKHISQSDYLDLSRNRPILAGDILISMIGTIGEVARVKKTDLDFYGQNMYLIRLNEELINSDYFLHFFDSPRMKNHFNSVKNNSGQGYLKANDIEKLQIPIPPLNVQAEIVRILDTFTELTAELTARQQQYAYYRDQLLTFEEGEVEWRLLGDVTVYEQPTKYRVKSKEYNDDFLTPVLTAGKTFILGYTNEVEGIYTASKKPVIIFDDFTTANKWVDFDFKVKSSAMKMITTANESEVMQKYIYYWLNTLPSDLVAGDHKRQWISNFSNKRIPIPPLSEQKRIVSILDKFDTLTTSLTEGLPREIELRQQQYEYYRDLLLSFPKPEVVAHD